jgi:hypothetical protein
MRTHLKYIFFGFLFVTLSSGALGCEPWYHHRGYGDSYSGSGWGRPGYGPQGPYGPDANGDNHEGRHRPHDHDDD